MSVLLRNDTNWSTAATSNNQNIYNQQLNPIYTINTQSDKQLLINTSSDHTDQLNQQQQQHIFFQSNNNNNNPSLLICLFY